MGLVFVLGSREEGWVSEMGFRIRSMVQDGLGLWVWGDISGGEATAVVAMAVVVTTTMDGCGAWSEDGGCGQQVRSNANGGHTILVRRVHRAVAHRAQGGQSRWSARPSAASAP